MSFILTRLEVFKIFLFAGTGLLVETSNSRISWLFSLHLNHTYENEAVLAEHSHWSKKQRNGHIPKLFFSDAEDFDSKTPSSNVEGVKKLVNVVLW